jgi:hypothetical protein
VQKQKPQKPQNKLRGSKSNLPDKGLMSIDAWFPG